MKKLLLFTAAFLTMSGLTIAQTQNFAIELMTGHKNYWYQHSLNIQLPNSRFGFFHSSSLHLLYDEKEKNEVMSQSYVTYPLTSFISLAAGTFYATKPGISPSVAAQFKIISGHLRFIIVPRVDLKNNGAVEAMTMLEYLPPINERLTFYSRLQLMSNYGPHSHNRSYQYLRFGIRTQKTTVGFAVNVDERGPEKQTMKNLGVFLKYDI